MVSLKRAPEFRHLGLRQRSQPLETFLDLRESAKPETYAVSVPGWVVAQERGGRQGLEVSEDRRLWQLQFRSHLSERYLVTFLGHVFQNLECL